MEKVTGEPLMADIFKGNRADVSIVVENLIKLRRALKKKTLYLPVTMLLGSTPKFKVADRRVFIDHPDRSKLEAIKETKPFFFDLFTIRRDFKCFL
ncbi:MAG TPA: hypothetical protein VLH18_05685 [Candidatus Limnocylindrales bacterium]|nr:hypothetical protein [Candidatus Limnocylindrales bacterium]